jgi:hypothetical protein
MEHMTEMSQASAAQQGKAKPWVKPEVRKIRAGDAEVGTRATPDGAFTTS